ncbi:MAG: hypothetical protein ACPG77_13470 [Nannocystaceae bacterium]
MGHLRIGLSALFLCCCQMPNSGSGGTDSEPETSSTSTGGTSTADLPTDLDPEMTVTLSGVAEKGPLLAGSPVYALRVTPDGAIVPSPMPIKTHTTDALGHFSLPDVPSGPVVLAARGQFFWEPKQKTSSNTVTLRVLHRADGDNTTVNINVLTHIVDPRARKLMADGLDIEEAIAQAEHELVAALPIVPPDFSLENHVSEAQQTGLDTDDK